MLRIRSLSPQRHRCHPVSPGRHHKRTAARWSRLRGECQGLYRQIHPSTFCTSSGRPHGRIAPLSVPPPPWHFRHPADWCCVMPGASLSTGWCRCRAKSPARVSPRRHRLPRILVCRSGRRLFPLDLLLTEGQLGPFVSGFADSPKPEVRNVRLPRSAKCCSRNPFRYDARDGSRSFQSTFDASMIFATKFLVDS